MTGKSPSGISYKSISTFGVHVDVTKQSSLLSSAGCVVFLFRGHWYRKNAAGARTPNKCIELPSAILVSQYDLRKVHFRSRVENLEVQLFCEFLLPSSFPAMESGRGGER